jgi:hypothetical protein
MVGEAVIARFGVTRNTLRFDTREVDARWVLLAAIVAATLLDLWVGRGTTFTTDEIDWFSTTPGLDVHQALAPYNGHLILGARLVYDVMFHAFGVDYLPFRVLGVFSVIATVWLLFEFAGPRVGRTVALVPCAILLVFGSDLVHVIHGNAILDVSPLAFGIAALLAMEREDTKGDVAACVLLVLAAGTYSTGLAFIGGAAVWTLLDRSRWGRSWVFLVPGLLYVAWFIWASDQPAAGAGQVKIENLLLAPIWIADSIGNVSAALTGLNYSAFSTRWEAVAGAATVVLAVVALRRGVTARLLAIMAVPLTFWTLAAMAQSPPMRTPESSRYFLPGTVLLLLFAAEAARGVRWRRTWLAAIAAFGVFGLCTNLSLIKQGGTGERAIATVTRYDLAAVQATGGKLSETPPNSILPGSADPGRLLWPVLDVSGSNGTAAGYVRAVSEFGAIGYTEQQLSTLSPTTRTLAVAALQHAVGVKLAPAAKKPPCQATPAAGSGPVVAELPKGGAFLESQSGGAVSVSRFGSGLVPVGTLNPGEPASLVVPPDRFGAPWDVAVAAPAARICPLLPGQGG